MWKCVAAIWLGVMLLNACAYTKDAQQVQLKRGGGHAYRNYEINPDAFKRAADERRKKTKNPAEVVAVIKPVLVQQAINKTNITMRPAYQEYELDPEKYTLGKVPQKMKIDVEKKVVAQLQPQNDDESDDYYYLVRATNPESAINRGLLRQAYQTYEVHPHMVRDNSRRQRPSARYEEDDEPRRTFLKKTYREYEVNPEKVASGIKHAYREYEINPEKFTYVPQRNHRNNAADIVKEEEETSFDERPFVPYHYFFKTTLRSALPEQDRGISEDNEEQDHDIDSEYFLRQTNNEGKDRHTKKPSKHRRPSQHYPSYPSYHRPPSTNHRLIGHRPISHRQ